MIRVWAIISDQWGSMLDEITLCSLRLVHNSRFYSSLSIFTIKNLFEKKNLQSFFSSNGVQIFSDENLFYSAIAASAIFKLTFLFIGLFHSYIQSSWKWHKYNSFIRRLQIWNWFFSFSSSSSSFSVVFFILHFSKKHTHINRQHSNVFVHSQQRKSNQKK